jgi:hypothetical protein
MQQIVIGGLNKNIISDINDLTLVNFFNLKDIYENNEMSNTIKMMNIIPLISDITINELNDMYPEDLSELSTIMPKLNENNFKLINNSIFNFNGIVYKCKYPYKLTNGEYITIENLMASAKNDLDKILNYLSVVIRPTIEKIDEFGDKIYEIVPFDSSVNFDKRKELFKNIPANNAMYIIKAFMPGTN